MLITRVAGYLSDQPSHRQSDIDSISDAVLIVMGSQCTGKTTVCHAMGPLGLSIIRELSSEESLSANIPIQQALAEKDRPILAAAISATADYLATGDKNHFGHRYNTEVSGVCVISPAQFLSIHKHRILP